MNEPKKDWKIGNLREGKVFLQQNPFICASALVLGMVALFESVLLEHVIEQSEEIVGQKNQEAELRNEQIALLENLAHPNQVLLDTLVTKLAALQELSENVVLQQDLHTPCTRENYEELLVAQTWVQQRVEAFTQVAVNACVDDKDCPLVNDEAKAGFVDSLRKDIFETQFFCPVFDDLGVDEDGDVRETLASTDEDPDQDRIVQLHIRPSAFEAAEQNPCELVGNEMHEWIHAAANVRHQEAMGGDQQDWAYAMGQVANGSCIQNPPKEWVGRISPDASEL